MYVLCFTRPRYQVSVYRTIGPLVLKFSLSILSLCIFPGKLTKQLKYACIVSDIYFLDAVKCIPFIIIKMV